MRHAVYASRPEPCSRAGQPDAALDCDRGACRLGQTYGVRPLRFGNSCRPSSRRRDIRSSHHLPIHRSPFRNRPSRRSGPCRLIPRARQHGQCGIAGEPRIRRRELAQVEDRSTRRCDDLAVRARGAQAGVLVARPCLASRCHRRGLHSLQDADAMVLAVTDVDAAPLNEHAVRAGHPAGARIPVRPVAALARAR